MVYRDMKTITTCQGLSNANLLSECVRLAAAERSATVQLIAALAEVDRRRLYLGEGCSSLFTYCTRVLHLSEHAAYGRIEAARAAHKFPLILDLLAEGALTLTSVTLLAPSLTDENHRAVLGAARHRSKREVEEQVAALRPQPAVAASVRKLPVHKPTLPRKVSSTDTDAPPCAPLVAGLPGPTPQAPAVVRAAAPEQYRIQITVSKATHDKLRRAQDLLRHSIPNGDPAAIVDRALALLLENLEKRKLAATERPRQASDVPPRGRHIAASVRREVWKRDEGQCAFVGTQGRCEERGFLEFHHVEPFAAGGAATIENIELRCRAHNGYEADLFFRRWMVREDAAVVEARLGPDRVDGWST